MKSPFIMFAERRLLLSIALILSIYGVGSDWGKTNDEQLENIMFKNLTSSELRPKTYKRLYTLKVALLDLFKHIWNMKGGWRYQQIWETDWTEPSLTQYFTVKIPDWKKGPKVKKLCVFNYEDYYTTNKSRLMTRIYRKLRYDSKLITIIWMYVKHQGLLIETIMHPYLRFRSWAPCKRDLILQIVKGELPEGHKYKWDLPSLNIPTPSRAIPFIVILALFFMSRQFDLPEMFNIIGMLGAVYVSTVHGSDASGDPTNPATPIQTLAFARTLDAPGQTTYLDRTETFAEPHNANSSGNFANRVIWNGNGWDFSGTGSSADHVLLDDAGVSTNMIFSDGNSYRTYEGIDTANATGSMCLITGSGGISYITFDDCVLTDSGGSSLVFRYCSNGVMRDCEAIRPGNGGFVLKGNVSNGNNNCSVIDCTAYDAVTNDGVTFHVGATAADINGNYNIITGGSYYNMPEQGLDLTSGSYISVYAVECYDNGEGSVVLGHDSTDNDICYNWFHDEADAPGTGFGIITIRTVRNRCYNNLLETTIATSRMWGFNTTTEAQAGDLDNYVHYNRTIASTNVGNIIRYTVTTQALGTFHVTNNTFQYIGSTSNAYVNWSVAAHGPGDDEYDRNTWFNSTTHFTDVDDGNFTLAQFFSVYGNGEHSDEEDPLVVDTSGGTSGFPDDAYLQSGSPCIGGASPITTGVYIDNTGTPTTGISVDIIGNARDLIASDRGFHEYGAAPPPAPSSFTVATIENGDLVSLEGGDEIESNFVLESGGQMKQLISSTVVKVTGDIEIQIGAILGFSGNDFSKVDFTGTITNYGTNYWVAASPASTIIDTPHDIDHYLDWEEEI